jgi:hypothetical protein
MRMTRFIKSLAVFTLAAGPLLALGGAGTAAAVTTPASTLRATSTLQLKTVQVRLSAAQQRRLAKSGVRPATGSAFEIVTEGKYCLDANASGSTAGKDGDAVTLWTCTGGTNQYWYVGRSDVDGYNTLVNDRWTGECLNVDNSGGEGNGSKVQLWHCSITTSNEFWNTHEWQLCINNGCSLPYLYNEGGAGLSTPVLDAVSQSIGNGDKVQVWQSNGGANQFWR